MIFLLILVLYFTLIPYKKSLSNDISFNENLFVFENKIHCLIFKNLQNLPENKFLVYKYSESTALKLKRPWSIIEEGKCYEYGGEIFEVEIVNGNEIEEFKNYKNESIFQKENVRKIYDSREFVFDFINSDNYFFNILEILPTKYDFGLFIRYNAVSFREGEIKAFIKVEETLNSNKDFMTLKEELEELAKEFNHILRNCDKRKRIEHIINVNYENGEIILRKEKEVFLLEDNKRLEKDFIVNSHEKMTIDYLKLLEVIGCRESYSEFINYKKDKINKIDELSEKLYYELRKLLEDIIKNEYKKEFLLEEILKPKDPTIISYILNYVKETPNYIEKSSKKLTNEETPDNKLEETKENLQKINSDYLIKSKSDRILKIYFILPLFSLLILLIYLVIKKK